MRALASFVLVAFVALPCASSRAQDATQVVALVASDDARARIEGQIADLPWQVLAPESAVALDDAWSALGQARRLASERGARAFVAVLRRGARLVVWICEPDASRLLVRELDVGSGPLAESAALEAAALVVRASLQLISVGGHVGERVEPPPEPEPVQEPVAEPAVPPEPPVVQPEPTPVELPPAPPASTPIALGVALGVQSTADGLVPVGAHGARLEVSARVGAWQFGLSGLAGLPLTVGSDSVTVRLGRHALGASIGLAHVEGPLRFGGQVGAGVLFEDRETVVTTVNLQSTPSALLVLPRLTLELHASLELVGAPQETGLSLGLGLGADLLPIAPSLRIGSEPPLTTAWPLAPWAMLAIEFHWVPS